MKAAFYGSFTLSLYPYFTSHKPHYEKEVPFEIPKSWEWVRISDIGLLKAGSFIKAQDIKSEKSKDLFPCYGGNGLRGYVDIYNYEGIYSLIGRQGALCGNINLVEGKFYATEHAVTTTFWGGIDLYWMFYALKALNLNQYAIGAAQPGLSVEKINNIYCPLPPRSEQKRISSKIKSLFVLIERMDDNLLSLDQLIDQAKSKIVDLAIRGKLVPQDPNDEPASVLLERIKKKTHKTTTDKSHYPFEIPENWVWCKLDDIGDWRSGATPSRTNKDYYKNGDINWLKTGDLTDGFVYDIPEKITQKALLETSVKLNPVGSILIAMYGATIGKVGILTEPATTNQACCACSNFKGINNMFLFYLLIAYRDYFVYLGEGGAQPNISKEKITSTYIPLPPLAEQKRIVSQIEKIFVQLEILEDSLKA